VTPTDTILALEKALEDQSRRLQEFAHDEVPVHVTRGQLRTLLDAHASALRDAEKLRAKLDALDNLPAEEFIRKIARQMGPPPFDTWPVSHVCQQNADEAVELVAEYDRLAALDDNTKGAAE
jgi:hypothetical protein